jgi:carbonic anhydrase
MVIYNLLILLLILNCKGDDVHWDYSADGPDVWPENFAACGGENQSPINIKTKCTIQEHFQPFRFTFNHNQPIDFNLTNNGHTIVAKTNTPSLSIQGANLSGIFYFDSFHLHWGPNHNSGSEHQMYVYTFYIINNIKIYLEMVKKLQVKVILFITMTTSNVMLYSVFLWKVEIRLTL